MREERQMLGQMINQVHQQQQELKELQTDITTKLDSNAQSFKNQSKISRGYSVSTRTTI